jgi:hypothetical protein
MAGWVGGFCAGAVLGMALAVYVFGRRAARAVRAQRHRLANRLQVVDGWLQLGRPDQALHPLGEVLAELAGQGRWLGPLPWWCEWAAFQLETEAERAGIALQFAYGDLPTTTATVRTLWVLWAVLRRARVRAGKVAVVVDGSAFRITVEGDAGPPKRVAGLKVEAVAGGWRVAWPSWGAFATAAEPPDAGEQSGL